MPLLPAPLNVPPDATADPLCWARAVGTSVDAVELYRSSEVFDLHLDSFIWTRIFGTRLAERHGRSWTGRRYRGQVDLPRALDGGLTGGIWSVTTNPFRPAAKRAATFAANLPRLRTELEAHPAVEIVTTVAGYRDARARGRHGAFLGIQGANAVDASPTDVQRAIDGGVVRMTLVHLTSSDLGTTSSPLSKLGRRAPFGAAGRALVEQLDAGRVLVDLAHISEAGFWGAVDAHDRALPLIVTHTGVDGVWPHWRNLSDDQIRAVADSGGCVGVMLQESFLGKRPTSAATVVDHLAHLVAVGGEGCPAIGTDFDGMVTPPRDLARHAHFPRLVEEMRRRRWTDERIRAVLGGNALRTIEALRG